VSRLKYQGCWKIRDRFQTRQASRVPEKKPYILKALQAMAAATVNPRFDFPCLSKKNVIALYGIPFGT
jgi:hypothetical protein